MNSQAQLSAAQQLASGAGSGMPNLTSSGAGGADDDDDEKKDGLGISFGEVDSAISGLGKMSLQNVDNASRKLGDDSERGSSLSVSQVTSPQTA